MSDGTRILRYDPSLFGGIILHSRTSVDLRSVAMTDWDTVKKNQCHGARASKWYSSTELYCVYRTGTRTDPSIREPSRDLRTTRIPVRVSFLARRHSFLRKAVLVLLPHLASLWVLVLLSRWCVCSTVPSSYCVNKANNNINNDTSIRRHDATPKDDDADRIIVHAPTEAEVGGRGAALLRTENYSCECSSS